MTNNTGITHHALDKITRITPILCVLSVS